jgi:hypothetical protein
VNNSLGENELEARSALARCESLMIFAFNSHALNSTKPDAFFLVLDNARRLQLGHNCCGDWYHIHVLYTTVLYGHDDEDTKIHRCKKRFYETSKKLLKRVFT